ncbi:hypothetical protein S7711_02268 [Stachybotrys chartarum IBT 7711]|uniref:Uncharacterized protein n=1 Tax=Stachybotrys chartarum (strain CBS 109288 / IBT 7711) TaxID=1280523 RepID=A0A084AZD9_STACB|nr:hypothetical protein S7711_02268 [Stachybotrys chartarum IBT 7711]KFA53060.1 hypothetical protein S40293_05296 [Stachybotrys chartarum IBT 40293]
MESLQLSQVLADLSNLGAAEPEAAAAIVSANTTILAKTDNVKTEPSNAPQLLQRPSSGLQRSWSFDPSSQPKVDKFGRRIHVNTSNSRSGSTTSSIPGTPRHDYSMDDDLERASTLMALYEIRSKLKQQDNSSLIKAREKINALAAKQQAQQAAERNIKTAEELKRTRFSFHKPGL